MRDCLLFRRLLLPESTVYIKETQRRHKEELLENFKEDLKEDQKKDNFK
jgi:hypothetical protein